MTSAETTPSPRPSPAHADGGEYGETDQEFGRGAYQLPPDGGPAPASSAGPTADEDAPVLLPVDAPGSRYEDDRIDDRTDDGTDDRLDDRTDDRTDDRIDDRTDDGTEDRLDDRADDQTADRTDDRTDDVLPGEDRPADDVYVADSGRTDGLPAPTPASTADAAEQPDGVTTPERADGGSGLSSSGSGVDWHELQSRFVDDPAAAVAEAADHVEQALRDLRGRIGNGDTEQLRTAFKRYRDFYSSLS
jgi:hypothetical protein